MSVVKWEILLFPRPTVDPFAKQWRLAMRQSLGNLCEEPATDSSFIVVEGKLKYCVNVKNKKQTNS